jgi:hypothetical protein
MKPQPIMIIATFGNQEKQIILQKEHEFSGIYHVIIDDELEAQVLKTPKGKWEVVPHTKSWLTDENCDLILKTVLNLENPNF